MELHEFQRSRKIGEINVTLPEPPNKNKIFGYGLTTSNQKFYKTEIPGGKDFHLLPKQEQMDFFTLELERREKGFWFWNNGEIEYITGTNYFFLNYWWLGDKYGHFIDAQRDVFYFWESCVKDNNCYGGYLVSGRRFGKTSIGTCILYDDISRKFNRYGGIQSITERAAKEVFRKLIASWRRLHPIWKPTDSGDTNPKSSLRFEEPSKRSNKSANKIYKDVLDSWIDYRHSEKEAYDGQIIHRMYNDEAAKNKDVDIYERWLTQKYCLIDKHEAVPIIGKAFFTTTVEEPSRDTKVSREGTRQARKLWDHSGISTMNDEFGTKVRSSTESGLYRMFMPAYYGRIYNEYGYSDIEAGKQDILKDRDGKKGRELFAIVRKDPMSENEAWIVSDDDDVFPAHKIHEQLSYNAQFAKGTVRRGNFVMYEEGKVEFYDDPKGRWEASWFLPEEERNKSIIKNGRIAPGNVKSGCIGVDPYGHKTTSGDRKSEACAAFFRNFSFHEMYISNCYCAFYLHRPEDPNIFFDDVLNACVYYGVQHLTENTKSDLFNFFRMRGYQNYTMMTQASEYTKGNNRAMVEGISTNGEDVRTQLVNGQISYINDNVGSLSKKAQVDLGLKEYNPSIHGHCPYDRLLNDWLDFKFSKWTDYDASVGSMIARLGAKRIVSIKRKSEEEAPFEIKFPTYKI